MSESRDIAGRQAGRRAGRRGEGAALSRNHTTVGPVPRKAKAIRHHWEQEVHQLAAKVAMQIFELSKKWPPEERYSLTDQARRSSRSVAAQIAEAWRKRKYEAAFVSKLSDAEGEAAETQDWVTFAVRCGYLERKAGLKLHHDSDLILAKLTKMGNNPGPWLLNRTSPKPPD
jgi:four helix bundle protein